MAIVLSPPPSSIISLEVWCDTATTAASPLISHLYISLVFHNLDINVHIRRIILDLNSMLKDHLNMESYLTLGCGMLVIKVRGCSKSRYLPNSNTKYCVLQAMNDQLYRQASQFQVDSHRLAS